MAASHSYAKSAAEILKAIGCPHLQLYRCFGQGYWYFIYDTLDDVNGGGKYDSESIYTPRLNDMTVERWAEAGKAFVARVEAA